MNMEFVSSSFKCVTIFTVACIYHTHFDQAQRLCPLFATREGEMFSAAAGAVAAG